MAPQLQQAVMAQLSSVAPMLQQKGQIAQMQPLSDQPTPDGGKLYFIRVMFSGGSSNWQIGVAPDGTLTALYFVFQ